MHMSLPILSLCVCACHSRLNTVLLFITAFVIIVISIVSIRRSRIVTVITIVFGITQKHES